MATTKKAAATKTKATVSVPKTLSVGSRPGAKFETLVKDLQTALGKVGCRGCRSGIDKIVIGDIVQQKLR
ncbi:MAG TPA: hypothetical protein VGC61_01835 [Pyrinomonadaceae bacterium]|jgi:hypothetical protein